MKKLIAAALSTAAILATAAPAMAQRGDDFRRAGGGYGYELNLRGLSVDEAKRELSSEGYRAVRNIRFDGRQYDLWSNARARNSCVGFTSLYGRITDVKTFADSECGLVSSGRRLDADDLRGLRVDDAKRNLSAYGFNHLRNARIDGVQWDLWLSDRGRECIGFSSYKGVVNNARSFRGNECDGNGQPGAGRWLDADDLRGLSVDGAKWELSNAGFRHARNIRINGKQWDLWRDDSGRNDRCYGFTSYNGRVTDADTFRSSDCY